MSSQLQYLTANLAATPRRESLGGREYLVAPVTLICPGVLNGSQGPLLYELSEISRNPEQWNGVPVVVNHPTTEDGRPASARSPGMLEKHSIGTVFNAVVDGKLQAEGWFDIERASRLMPKEFAFIEQGKPVELSTGLYSDNEPVKNKDANFNGTPYTHIAKNHRPDHLAILVDGKRGACDLRSGCGVNVNEEGGNADDEPVDNQDPGEPTDDQLSNYVDFDETSETTDNQLSHSDLRGRLSELVMERFGEVHITDVYDCCVVYSVGNGRAEKFYRLGYTADKDDNVILDSNGAEEVARKTEYEPVANRQWWELILVKNELVVNPLPSEHSARQRDPKDYKRVRRQNNKFGEGIHALFGVKEDGKTELQSVHFDESKFTVVQAKKWLKDNKMSLGSFSPAKPTENAFCPTGKGGGKDPSCGKGSTGKSGKLPPRTADTMSEAIAMSSPSGKQSKRSKKAAAERHSKALFGEGGLKVPTAKQLPEAERLRKQAKELKDLASRGMSKRKFTKKAAELEAEADKLERAASVSNEQLQNRRDDMSLTGEQKEQVISGLIANEGIDGDGPWTEEDREALEAMPEDKLVALNAQRELIVNAQKTDEGEAEEPTENEGPKTLSEWMATAPAEVQSVVNNALAFERKQKEQLIKCITDNERNAFSAEYLQSRSIDELQGIARLATNEENKEQDEPVRVFAPNYAGVPAPTVNVDEGFRNEDLDMAPIPYDWSQK